jgi:hypothetical protein
MVEFIAEMRAVKWRFWILEKSNAMRSKFLFLIGVFSVLASSGVLAQQIAKPDTSPVVDYIRYRSGANESQPGVLETATSRFQKGSHIINLVSVVHLGDLEYFKQLQQSLDQYNAVFYEMVGGPFTEEKAKMAREAASPDGKMAQVQGLQQMAKKLLGLEFQLDRLNYRAPNFVHADLTAEEMEEISGDQDMISEMLARALQLVQSRQIPGLPASEEEVNQLFPKLFGAVMAGDSNQLKRTLGPILAEAELFMIQLEEGEGTVLITKRNQVVIEKVLASIKNRDQSAKNDAILFGAGHMPDLERRLTALGYNKLNTTWDAAWVVNPGQSTNPNPLNLDEMLKQFTGMIEALKE